MSWFSRRPVIRRRGDLLGGLPGRLPAGETVLWQGRPDARILALRVLHVRKVAIYLGLMLAWFAIADFAPSHWERTLAGLLCLTLMAGVAISALILFAVLVSRSTVYTLTDRRVVLRIGIALTMSINLPLSLVDSASVRIARDGSGNIPLSMHGRQKLGYAVLWPHVRPWRFNQPQPMLRALKDAANVAALLSEALAATVPAGAAAEPSVQAAGMAGASLHETRAEAVLA